MRTSWKFSGGMEKKNCVYDGYFSSDKKPRALASLAVYRNIWKGREEELLRGAIMLIYMAVYLFAKCFE